LLLNDLLSWHDLCSTYVEFITGADCVTWKIGLTMNNKLIVATGLLLSLAATPLLVPAAAAADEAAEALAPSTAAIVVARASIAPQMENLDAENLETANSALSQALENLAQDNQSELELRISDRTFISIDTGK